MNVASGELTRSEPVCRQILPRSRLQHVTTAHPTLCHGSMGVGDLDRAARPRALAPAARPTRCERAGRPVERRRGAPPRPTTVIPRSVAGSELGWTPTKAPPSRTSARPRSCSTAAVGDRVPARLGVCGEVGAEAADERLVLGLWPDPSPASRGPARARRRIPRPRRPPRSPAAGSLSAAASPSRSTICAAASPLSGTVDAATRSSRRARPRGRRPARPVARRRCRSRGRSC